MAKRNQLENPELRAALMDSTSHAVSTLPTTKRKGGMGSIEELLDGKGNEIEVDFRGSYDANNGFTGPNNESRNDHNIKNNTNQFSSSSPHIGAGSSSGKMEESELAHEMYPQRNRKNYDNSNSKTSNSNRSNKKKDQSDLPMLFKVRLQMSSGKVQEVLIKRGEAATNVAQRLAKLYQLKHDEEHEVLKQLIQAGI